MKKSIKSINLKKITLSSKVLILSIFFYLVLLIIIFLILNINPNVKEKEVKISKIEDVQEKTKSYKEAYVASHVESDNKPTLDSQKNKSNKHITIPSIGMFNEEIYEGVDQNTLENNIGHFTFSPDFNGNVCLAAHNYSVHSSDLFKNLNKLKTKDEVIYSFNGTQRKYAVKEIFEIASNDFSVLGETSENVITCITCTQNNDKNKRLCLKAVEIKEEK